jgi:hypothetical protein
VDSNFNEPGKARLAHNAVFQRASKKVRKDGDNLKPHSLPSSDLPGTPIQAFFWLA